MLNLSEKVNQLLVQGGFWDAGNNGTFEAADL
jgi:hypothetical protein